MDLDYLILFQTYAILILPGVSVAKQDRVIEEAMSCLRGVFQAAENDDSCWFAGFPCATETDVEGLHKWMSRASGLLNTFVAHLQAMVDTHQRQLTFPLRDELHARYPYSTLLQDTLVTALLVHVWLLPLDVCLSKVLEAYKIAQVNRVSMVQNSPTVLHQTLLGSEDTRLMTAINSYSREHMDHSAFPTAINPMMQPLQWQTIASAPSAQIANLIRSLTTQTNALRQTSMIASMEASDQLPQRWTTTGLIQQNLNIGHVTFQSGLPMYNIQQVTPPILRNYFLPNAENIWQVSQGTYPCVPPEEQALLSLPTLPQVSPGYHSGSETVYHMQLAYPIDPISIVQCTGSQSEIDFRTHVTSFLCMPWRFGVATISKDVTFELSEEGLSKLVKEVPDAMGGHPIRPVKSGTQFIRLRGVRGRPKTLSEFVATKTHWPISMVILLNGQPVELRRKPESPSNMAVDVTSRLHLGTNVLKICFRRPTPAPKKFCYLLALEIVEVAHITDMKAMVSPNDIEVVENLLRSRFQGGDDDEDQMMLDQVDITITDPYTSKILDTPVKSIHCTHLQCFDLDVFLHSRPKDLNTTKEFICPFCDKDARPESLKIDSWMSRVIQEVKERNRYDAKVITVTPDLRWIIKGDDLIGKSKNGTGTRGNGRSKESKGKIVEVIELE